MLFLSCILFLFIKIFLCRKLYVQSISHQSVPYQIYMKRKTTKPLTANSANTASNSNLLSSSNPIMRTSSGAIVPGSLEIQTGYPASANGTPYPPSTPMAGGGYTPIGSNISSRPSTSDNSSPMMSQKLRRNAVTRESLTPQALSSSSHSFNAGTASMGTMMTVMGNMSTPSKRAVSSSAATRAGRLGSISLHHNEINRTLTSDSYADRLDILTSEVENMLAEMQHKKIPESPHGSADWTIDTTEGRKSATMISRAPKQRKRQNSLMDALQSSVVHGKAFF
jgi:hypothetical protein